MIWFGLILIIAGVIVQDKTENKKLGKVMWIAGAVILVLYAILVLGVSIWSLHLLTSSCMI